MKTFSFDPHTTRHCLSMHSFLIVFPAKYVFWIKRALSIHESILFIPVDSKICNEGNRERRDSHLISIDIDWLPRLAVFHGASHFPRNVNVLKMYSINFATSTCRKFSHFPGEILTAPKFSPFVFRKFMISARRFHGNRPLSPFSSPSKFSRRDLHREAQSEIGVARFPGAKGARRGESSDGKFRIMQG